MSQISKILYATDLSESAKPAMAWARSLAGKYDAQINVIHVIPDASKEISAFGADRKKPSISDERDAAISSKKNEILALCKKRHSDLPTCTLDLEHILIKLGAPVAEIIDTVENGDFDILVLGTRSKSLIDKVFLGSVARGVMDQCPIPVLTVRLPPK
ncbi:MAG: universal stress protein [Desulfocapsa sp.]|nr:universal stress protein [Desulfocapsa sp.]